MAEKKYTAAEVLTILTETPAQIAALTEGLSAKQLCAAPGPKEWSANDVLAHLRSCADVWGDYIHKIVTQDHPSIKAVSPRTWIKKTDYPRLEFQPSFVAFAGQRAGLLTFLEALSPEEWARTASVTAVGRPYERTVLNFGERMARHEREHVRQIKQIVKSIRG